MLIERVSLREANAALTRGPHYLGPVTFRPRYSLAQFDDDMALDIVALAVYSSPVASWFTKSLPRSLELARLWQSESVDVPLSKFLAASLRWLRANARDAPCVFSYADPAVRDSRANARGHHRRHSGGVYVAANFVFLGETRADNVSYSWQTETGERISGARCYRLFGTRSRKKIAALRPDWRLIESEPRLLYCYPMALTVAQVIERIGGPGRHYQAIKSPPSPLD